MPHNITYGDAVDRLTNALSEARMEIAMLREARSELETALEDLRSVSDEACKLMREASAALAKARQP